MIRALYTAASGMLNGLRNQDVAAGNLSNASTIGYKAESSASTAFAGVLARRVGTSTRAPVPGGGTQELGRVGTGVYQSTLGRDASDGTQRLTDEPFDFALSGPGFFAVQTPDGVQYTRDGHFHRDATDTLVSAEGYPVLDADGQPITLAGDEVSATSGGVLLDGDVPVAVLQVVEFDIDGASRAGHTRFLPNGAVTAAALGVTTFVRKGALEEANVDLARTATSVMSVSRAFEASQQVFSTVDETLAKAASELGRV